MIELEAGGGVPLYEQLYRQLRRRSAAGSAPPERRCPGAAQWPGSWA